MQGKLQIFKITSKQYPDKQWDKPTHFINHTQDRQILRKHEQYMLETKFDWVTELKNNEYHNELFLSDDRKSLFKVEMGTDKMQELNWNNFNQPHIDKGIWNVEKIMSITLDRKKLRSVVRAFKKGGQELEKWMIDSNKK